jgi:hypothetical protein
MEVTMKQEAIGKSMSLPSVLLRLEGAAGFIGSLALYFNFGGDILPLVLLILAPDLSALGYLVNKRIGALTYNIVHTYVLPGALLALGLATNSPVVSQIASIWLAHISMDRMVGYGLKYPSDFKDTHLQRV